jgi:hypothetical protein
MFYGMKALSEPEELNYYAIAYEAIAFLLLIWMEIAVVSLWVFHTYLAITNKTTFEVIKARKLKNTANVVEKDQISFIENLCIFHCARMDPKWIYSPQNSPQIHSLSELR